MLDIWKKLEGQKKKKKKIAVEKSSVFMDFRFCSRFIRTRYILIFLLG